MPDPKTLRGPLLFAALPAIRPQHAPALWPRLLTEAAIAAERAGLDALVVESGAGLPGPALDPVVVLAALAPRTYRLGLVAELPADSPEPGGAARELASLDAISGGRGGCLLPKFAAVPSWEGRPPVVLRSSADGLCVTGTGLSLDVLTMAPGDSATDRLASALTGSRADGFVVRFPAGPETLGQFAHESVPLLREHGLLPAAARGPRRLRERLPAVA
ncbi:LLM class flavin-dependent oxidoreductase [Streptomyces sp. NPDC007020]|uniref:LLM class flavin-dependent oxidoreductase n=1 Tax=unclassified Streptomyces TaxID=2593676 RepID=UPI0033F14E48